MNYEAVIESILFTMGDSVELSKLAEVLELDKKEVKDIIEQMQKNYEAEDRGITITAKALRTDRRIVRDAFNYRI